MNLLDLLILLPIAYYGYRGFMNGFIREFFGIAGIILAVFVAFRFMGPVAGFAAPFVEDTDRATITAGIILFFITIAMIQIAAFSLEKAFYIIRVSMLNQLAGLAFGALKAGILVSAILLLFAGVNLPGENTRTESATYPVVIYLAPAAYDMIATIYPGAENFVRTIEKSIKENNTLRTLPFFDTNETDS